MEKEVGQKKIVFSTEFTVPIDDTSGEPDPAIDPLNNGFRIALVDEDEVAAPTLWSGSVEGGAYDKATKTGWKVNKAGTTWTFKGRDREDGIIKVVVKTLYRKEPGLVKVKVVAKNAAVAGVDGPVQGEISLHPAGFCHRCAQTAFSVPPAAEFCVANGAGTGLICR